MAYSIITISREYGTGARLIGREVAALLGYGYFDRALIEMAAEKSGLSEEFIERTEEKASNSFLYNLATAAYISSELSMQYTVPVNDRAFMVQSDVIRDIARSSNGVIVGRCADYILRDRKPFRIFVYADMQSRIDRCRSRAPEGENMSDKEYKQQITGMDKSRARYYDFYTDMKWGDKLNYELCINTTNQDIPALAGFVAKIFK